MSTDPSGFGASPDRSLTLYRPIGFGTKRFRESPIVSDQNASLGGSPPAGKCMTEMRWPPRPTRVVDVRGPVRRLLGHVDRAGEHPGGPAPAHGVLQSREAATEAKRLRPSRSARYFVASWPRTLLPAGSKGGENV